MPPPAAPAICVAVPLEDDLAARLAEAGAVTRVDPEAPRARLLAALGGVHGVLLSTLVPVDAEFLDAAPALRVVSTAAVGYDNYDVALATRRGVAICHTPGVLNAAVADLTMALVIALSRRLFEFGAYASSGAWARGEPQPPLARDIAGKTLGVVGYGRIGREVARRMRALGMRVVWHDVSGAPALADGEDAPDAERRTLDELLRESDYVSVHANLTPQSRRLIGARELALMRPGAYLVNTARGPVVDQAALTEALRSGAIAGAGLDVLETEPPDPDDPIVRLPNAIVLPHIGTATEETRRAMRELAVTNLIAALRGETPPAIVNPEALAARA